MTLIHINKGKAYGRQGKAPMGLILLKHDYSRPHESIFGGGSGLPYLRIRRKRHRKRIFSKTLSRVKIFENAGHSFYVWTDENGGFRER